MGGQKVFANSSRASWMFADHCGLSQGRERERKANALTLDRRYISRLHAKCPRRDLPKNPMPQTITNL
jgi:hypothetical protein